MAADSLIFNTQLSSLPVLGVSFVHTLEILQLCLAAKDTVFRLVRHVFARPLMIPGAATGNGS